MGRSIQAQQEDLEILRKKLKEKDEKYERMKRKRNQLRGELQVSENARKKRQVIITIEDD
jgi:hypothetical protein